MSLFKLDPNLYTVGSSAFQGNGNLYAVFSTQAEVEGSIQTILSDSIFFCHNGLGFYLPSDLTIRSLLFSDLGLTDTNASIKYDNYVFCQGDNITLKDMSNNGPNLRLMMDYGSGSTSGKYKVKLLFDSQGGGSSYDYYDRAFSSNDPEGNPGSILQNTLYLEGDDAVISAGVSKDGHTLKCFGFIPVFSRGFNSQALAPEIGNLKFWIISLYGWWNGSTSTPEVSTQYEITEHVVGGGASNILYVTHVPNSNVPVGGSNISADYQVAMSLFKMTDVTPATPDGSRTTGNEVYNDPDNPNASAYPAQGYDSQGNARNLWEQNQTGGIGGLGSHESWTDDATDITGDGLPTYLGGNDSTGDITDTDFLSIYELTQSQVRTLASKLWTTGFLTSLSQANLNPLECVIGLFKSKIKPEHKSSGNVVIGLYDTEITADTCRQYKKITLPDFKIERYWDTWLDQNPHTKLYLYLPYVGLTEINADYYMGRYLRIEYVCDFLVNQCIVNLYAIDNDRITLVETKQGDFGMQIPVTSSRRDGILGSIAQVLAGGAAAAAGIGSAIATFGADAPLSAAAVATGIGAITGAVSGGVTAASGGLSLQKYDYKIAGTIQSNAAFMSSNHVYIFRVLDCVQLPQDYSEVASNTAYVGTVLGNLKGFSTVKNIRLKNLDATQEEVDELLKILFVGAYFPGYDD